MSEWSDILFLKNWGDGFNFGINGFFFCFESSCTFFFYKLEFVIKRIVGKLILVADIKFF